jgi:transcriptional regulator with XRE-family HTH domain
MSSTGAHSEESGRTGKSDMSDKVGEVGQSAAPPCSLRPPSLGGYLRSIRRLREFSREHLAKAAGVSTSYITQLESGEKSHPSVAALQSLAAALTLDDGQLRHLYHLARLDPEQVEGLPRRPGPADVAALVAQLTPEMRMALEQLEPTLAAYMDRRWNVLAANKSYMHAFPGVVECGNILRWYFDSRYAKQIVMDWTAEASYTVKWLRGYLGLHADDTWASALLEEMSQYPEFVDMWLAGGVAFDRATPRINLRDPDSGAPYSMIIQIHQVTADDPNPHIGMFLGTRIPYVPPIG